ncbi:NADH-quinone oxidoreductase subunit N [Alistipes senegalensis]|uniref:NADH-quinone oxidoreductase subunit N n=1 Tax=Alistipes senegalensis TaxID=1288121 RepID=UPI00242D1D01|nr:NADH-quinone oxidoreductase subunit N [Alistipes senegalensis]MCI7309211.1 NADH-quinone oxidoreductase subunit N [Alistipes senegalensis]MDD7040169.1 NADH-quinone oxidoreductase subunit N [Alistipes senegalensis]MDY2877423.1 NADH-quinone oxidoreductase subunit N [Alistipes senegalensis]MDY5241879.1 NADH-quinone oxidoreductase subunit N [Alistipes senegalensis]
MDYTSIFTLMRAEVTLTAILVLVFLYDLVAGERGRRRFSAVVCGLLAVQTAVCLLPGGEGEAFGGMFQYHPMHGIVKGILAAGALVVCLQANTWLRREDTRHKQGEFYILTLSTLLGMYFMIGAGNFLLFFIGLELASVPAACLVAFDKYKRYSAEAGAKYILCALFSSGLMLYGISFLYGTTGTLYFDDMTARLTGSPLQVMALVFFFSGLGFKISLVPFHLWTADTYQGAPTAVTSYLSVVSKGAAAFVLLAVLVKVFAPMVREWQTLLWIVTVLSITVANLFAIRQKDLKRFMAFSSISQAGYIMLAVIGGSALGMTSLVFYVLVYMAANLAVFGVLSAVEQQTGGKVGMEDYNGFYKTNPRLAVGMTLALFSLAGIPPFAGFFSKFFVFAAAFEGGFRWLVFIALINTVISLYYYLLIVKAIYITPNDTPIAAFRTDRCTRIGLAVCMAGVLLLGAVSAVYDGINLFAFGL